MKTTKTIHLKKRPEGKPDLSNFEFTTSELPELRDNEVLLKTEYISVDPYLRGRMSDAESYIEPFEVNKPIISSCVAKVIDSKNSEIKTGDHVTGLMQWNEKQISKAENLQKVDPEKAPLSAYLGVLGITGLTAYFGLIDIGKPKKGETLLVSGAAGAVGTVVGQIGKILGMHVVGIAGTDEKIDMITSKFGYDKGINYKTTKDMKSAVAKACPNGVDVYYDNVGGEISEAVLFNINKFSRTVVCGAISVYNNTELPQSTSVQPFLIKKSSLMKGFVIFDYADKHQEGIEQLATWFYEDKLYYEETIHEGFDNVPQAFLDLFEGKNKGKMLVKV